MIVLGRELLLSPVYWEETEVQKVNKVAQRHITFQRHWNEGPGPSDSKPQSQG